jgi:phospholipid transport system substrate-binding protein
MSRTLIRSLPRSPLAAAALALVLIWIALAPAAMAAQDAGAFVAGLGTEGIQALGPQVSSSERFARLRQLLQQDFDLPGIGLFALGRYRWAATPQEQQEFFRLYPDFTVRALSARLDEFGGASLRVNGRRSLGNETIVSTEIVRADGRGVPFDWYLTDSDGQYRISDVIVAGVSMKIALRDQFASWIQGNGGRFSALLAVLRQQVAQAR